MDLVRFRDYRQYENTRAEANNAVMGLLAGAGLASHMLQLTEGSDRLLTEMFPNVPHIFRMNLKTAAAREILQAGDAHLGAMAVPYAMGIHEDYLKSCLGLLARAGHTLSKQVDDFKSFNQHEEVQQVTGETFTAASLQQFHTLRLMRNCAIHAGGRVDQRLINHLAMWGPDTEAGWVKVTARSPLGLKIDDVITFRYGEILIALACTKNLAREANRFLQPAVPRDVWADLVIEDFAQESSTLLSEPAPLRLRRCKGFARYNYEAIALTEAELSDAIARAT